MNKEKFSSEAISAVEECIEMFDVESLVEHALYTRSHVFSFALLFNCFM
jgi:hypothetical protein